MNSQLADENAKLEVAQVLMKEKLNKTIEEKKELKAKVTEQEKLLKQDPNAPSMRMLRGKMKMQGFANTMREGADGIDVGQTEAWST